MKKTLIAAALMTAASVAQAGEPYVKDADGNYVRDSWGECVRSIDWTPNAGKCPAAEQKATQSAPAKQVAAPAKPAPAAQQQATVAPPKGDIIAEGTDAYVIDKENRVVRDNFGGCVRSINWTKEKAIYECEGWKKPEPKPKVEPKKPPKPEFVPTFRGLFEVDSAKLTHDAFGKLDLVVDYLKKHPNTAVIIEGHTDSTGSRAYNQRLSERRANAVRDYLISQGISPDRITAIGYGEDKPIADNSTPEGRQLNRRVEVRIVLKN